MTIDDLLAEKVRAAVVTDENGLISYVNDAFTILFGWSREDILGRNVAVIIPPDLRDAHHLGFSRFLVTGAPTLIGRPLRLQGFTKGGRVFEAEHFIAAERREGRWAFGATIAEAAGR